MNIYPFKFLKLKIRFHYFLVLFKIKNMISLIFFSVIHVLHMQKLVAEWI